MKKNNIMRCIFCTAFCLILILGGTVTLLRTPDEISLSERRNLNTRPELSFESLDSGKFFTDNEKFLLDQFPGRDLFRRFKAMYQYDVLGKIANNNIVISDGQAAEINYPLKEKYIDIYLRRLGKVKDEYLADLDLRFYNTLIPDKIYYMNDAAIPVIDYDGLRARISEEGPGTYLDVFDTLSLGDYYSTDTHVKIASMVDMADRLLGKMDAGTVGKVRAGEELSPFYGVFYGRSALPLDPDTILPVYTDAIDQAVVKRYEGKVVSEGILYDLDKISAPDPYDLFLGGACTVLTIDNPTNPDGRTLYLFSDSFGRSLAPLLLSGYSRIVFYDIRYVQTAQALRILPVESGNDVLFAYSVQSLAYSPNLLVD